MQTITTKRRKENYSLRSRLTRVVREFYVLAGSPRHACIYRLKDAQTSQSQPSTVQPEICYEDMMGLFTKRQFSIPRLLRYIHNDPSLRVGRIDSGPSALVDAFSSLQALACAGHIYRLLPSQPYPCTESLGFLRDWRLPMDQT
jgi:hypothetical protein